MSTATHKIHQRYKVSIVSPLHIGAIHALHESIHFKYSEPNTLIYNNEPYVPNLTLPLSTNTIPEPALPWDISGITPLYTVQGKLYGNKIDLFTKDAWGNPVIPGNTLKGFFNSACAWLKRSVKTSQQTMPVSPFSYSDIPFSKSALELSDVKLLNLISEKKFGWKKFGFNPVSQPTPKTASSYYLETLKTGEFSIGTITFLSQDDGTELLGAFEQTLNSFSANIAEHEKVFYNACSMKELEQFYSSLTSKIPSTRNGFFICIGKGTGWSTITGSLYTPDETAKLRIQYNLGKVVSQCPNADCGTPLKIDKFNPHKLFCVSCKKSFSREAVKLNFFSVFPKTRKIAVKDEKTFFPLGWLKFERTESFELSSDPQTHSITIALRERRSKVIRTPFLTPEEYPAEKGQSSHYKKKIKIPDRGNFPTEYNMFLKQVAQLEFVLSIKGDTIQDSITTLQIIPNEQVDEIILHFSRQEKGIELTIKIGAINSAQKNFAVNRIWEILDSLQQNKSSDN